MKNDLPCHEKKQSRPRIKYPLTCKRSIHPLFDFNNRMVKECKTNDQYEDEDQLKKKEKKRT